MAMAMAAAGVAAGRGHLLARGPDTSENDEGLCHFDNCIYFSDNYVIHRDGHTRVFV